MPQPETGKISCVHHPLMPGCHPALQPVNLRQGLQFRCRNQHSAFELTRPGRGKAARSTPSGRLDHLNRDSAALMWQRRLCATFCFGIVVRSRSVQDRRVRGELCNDSDQIGADEGGEGEGPSDPRAVHLHRQGRRFDGGGEARSGR